jgi:hypothetical protein
MRNALLRVNRFQDARYAVQLVICVCVGYRLGAIKGLQNERHCAAKLEE